MHEDFVSRASLSETFVYETTDQEEALAFAENSIAPMKALFGKSGGNFSFRIKTTNLTDIHFLRHTQYIESGARFDVQYEDDYVVLEIPVEGCAQTCSAGKTHILSANKTGCFYNSGQRVIFQDTGSNEYEAYSFKVKKAALRRRFQQLIGADGGGDITFASLVDLTSATGREFLAIASIPIALNLDRCSIWKSPASAALFEEFFLNVLLTNFAHSRMAELEKKVSLSSPCAVRKCEDFLQAHAEEEITIGALAKAIGVSVRSLQRTFQQNTGTTPMRRLKEIRLEKARKRLLDASDGAGVTQIALGLGFSHLGAFGVDYKARYGEKPSETLRRRS